MRFLVLVPISLELAASQMICGDDDRRTCTCALLDNSGTIDLRNIGPAKNESWFRNVPSTLYPTQFFYSYNPCYEFTDCNDISGLALSMTPGDSVYPCLVVGTMSSSAFLLTDNGDVALHYSSYDLTRNAMVYLECNSSVETNTFIPYGDDWDRVNFTFKLRGPASCAIPFEGRSVQPFLIVIIIIVTLVCGLVCGVFFKLRCRHGTTDGTSRTTLQWDDLKRTFGVQSNRGDVLDDKSPMLN